jgi:hypothetical protein
MSIFSNILHKIFPGNHPAVTNPTPSVGSAGTSSNGSAPATATAPASATASAAAPASVSVATPSAPQPQAMTQVDVEAVLNAMAQKNTQKLNWRSSIVDLMKLLDLDSGLTARKELAHELGYSGDTNDSASMNIWLHKQVMRKLAENGGKVPADLQG